MTSFRILPIALICLGLLSTARADSTEQLQRELEALRAQAESRRATLQAELEQLNAFLGTEAAAPKSMADQIAAPQSAAVEASQAADAPPAILAQEPPAATSDEPESPFDIGSDLVSRYVWRGTDFGNSASIQPWIAYAQGYFEIGAWSSWALTAAGAGANENDLYISFSNGPFGLVLTDYYFPEGNNLFEYDKDTGAHILEISASLEIEAVSLLGAFNFWGDGDDSFYAEIGYARQINSAVGVSLAAGLGNGAYTTDTDPMLVNLSFGVSKGDYSATYTINPEAETNFLVFGRSF